MDSAVQHDSSRSGERLRRLVFRDQTTALLALLVSGWLMVGGWLLEYPFAERATDARLAESGAAIVVFLCALARWMRPLAGRVTGGLVAVVGVFLIGAPFAWSYGDSALVDQGRVNGLVCGALLLLLSGAMLLWSRQAGRLAERTHRDVQPPAAD